MKSEHFRAVLRDGHKGAAVEVPFDPTHRWGAPAVRLAPGRHGHHAHGRLNQTPFDSAIVPRGGGFFLLVSPETLAAAGARLGEEVEIVLHPGPANAPAAPARPRRKRSIGKT